MSNRNESYVPLLCNYPDSEKINKVSEGAEAMFCRLLAKCDDDGNYHGEPKRLLGKLFTLRYENRTMNVGKILRYRNELVEASLITCYESVTNTLRPVTVTYIHIIDCKKSLRKDVKKKLFFPEYNENTQTLMNTGDNTPRNESVTSRPESVTPIQSNPIQSKLKKERKSQSDSLIIFNHWNTFKGQGNWKSHNTLSHEIKKATTERLKHYSLETLKQATSNYAKILLSKEFVWSYAWTLSQFLTRHKKDQRDELQLYRFLPNNFDETDFEKTSLGENRDKDRKKYGDQIRNATAKGLLEKRKDKNKEHFWWLIDELRPEIKNGLGIK